MIVNTEHPLFDAIWQAIKGWDLERSHGLGYAGASGDDVQTIINAIQPLLSQGGSQPPVAWIDKEDLGRIRKFPEARVRLVRDKRNEIYDDQPLYVSPLNAHYFADQDFLNDLIVLTEDTDRDGLEMPQAIMDLIERQIGMKSNAGTDAAREPEEHDAEGLALYDWFVDEQKAEAAAARDDGVRQDARRYQALLDDPESARHLLLLLLQKRGTQDDFRRMQDRIAASREERKDALRDEKAKRDDGPPETVGVSDEIVLKAMHAYDNSGAKAFAIQAASEHRMRTALEAVWPSERAEVAKT